MPHSRIPSPARSLGPPVTPRRHKPRGTRSVGSPARSTASGRLSSIVDQFKENNRDSFAVSPLSKTVLTDDTEIEMPRRQSWWRKVDNSRDVIEVVGNENMNPVNVLEEFEMEVLTQEKKNYTMNLPESSDNETINSIVLPQRKLFIEKENHHQQNYDEIVGNFKNNKTNIKDASPTAGTRNLFGKTSKTTRPTFPSGLLNISSNKTLTDKTVAEPKAQRKGIFGNYAGRKRKNMFAGFVVSSESEDDIPEIHTPRLFTFHKQPEPIRRSSTVSRGNRESSHASNSTDIDMDDWKLLPSSTMVDHQLEAQLTTPGKRARLSKVSETKESIKTDSTKQSKKSMSSKGNSKSLSPAKNQKGDKSLSSAVNMKSSAEGETKTNEVSKIHDVSKILNNSKNKGKANLTKSKNMSLANNASDIVDEDAKESSNLKNKTYNINKTATKELVNNQGTQINQKEMEEVEEPNRNKQKEKTGLEDPQKDDEQFNLTYDDNEPEGIQENIDHVSKIPEVSKINDASKANELSKILNVSKNKTKANLSKSKNMSLANNASDIVDEDAKEASNLKNKTYNINKTATKELLNNDDIQNNQKEMEEVEEPNRDKQKEKTVLENPQEEDEQINLTYDDNETEDIQENVNHAKTLMDNETKAIHLDDKECIVDNTDNLEKELSKIVGQEDVLQVANEGVNETQGSKLEEQVHTENNTSAKEYSEKDKSRQLDLGQQEALVLEKSNNSLQGEEMEVQEIIEEPDIREVTNDEASFGEEHEEADSDDHGEVSDQDQAEASEEIEASDQEGTEVEQELETDDNEEEQEQESEDDVEASENEEAIDSGENLIENSDIINDHETDITQETEHEHDDEAEKETNASQNPDHAESQHVQDKSQEQEENIDDHEIHDISDGEHSNDGVGDNEQYHSNISHDTTGRKLKKRETNTPEAILDDAKDEMVSFMAKGRNTSVRKTKSLFNNFSIKPSLVPANEHTGLSDGTNNSSAEGSGWDSHRTTRRTLRQTFGKDFTPRKSLRALVMEKSAKRQTAIDEANLKLHQANSTELNNQDDQMDYEDDVEMESDHEVSRRTRLETYIQNIKKENMEVRQKINEQFESSLKCKPAHTDFLGFRFQVPKKPAIRRANKSSLQIAPKKKQVKSSLQFSENLPPELVEDMKYKPPKRYRGHNASWITKHLYKFLESKLEPKYDYKARVRAEKLVETINAFVRDIRRVQVAPPRLVQELKLEMARLNIVNTHFEFYNFFSDYLPLEVKIKVVPDILNDLPVPREGIYAPIISM